MFSRYNNIIPLRRKIIFILLVFTTLSKLSFANILPMLPCTFPRTGARAKFYEYPLNDTESYYDGGFLVSGYTNNIYLGEVTGVKNISWDSGWPAVVYPYGFKNVPITNFLVAITAYYHASQTGYFSMSLNADNFAAVYLGKNPVDFYCSLHEYTFTTQELLFTNNGSETATEKIYMKKGLFYPIKIIYVNSMERGILSVDMIKPDGSVEAGITENLYVMEERAGGISPASFTTKYLTSTLSSLPDLTAPTTVSTTTYTNWVSSDTIDVDIIYYVDEPLSTTIPTATTDASEPITSPYTTLVTGSIGSFTTSDVSVPVTSTYTTLVTGSFGSSSPQVFFNFDVEVEVRY